LTTLDNEGAKSISFDLSHEVQFVTAHPCIPSRHTQLINLPTSPPSSKGGSPERKAISELVNPHPGHPLHRSYTYSYHHLSDILFPTTSTSADREPFQILEALSSPDSKNEVFVIDCSEVSNKGKRHIADQLCLGTSGLAESSTSDVASDSSSVSGPGSTHERNEDTEKEEDAEMLARAWCAENGFNAVISRKHTRHDKDTKNSGCCIACSVRETRALGWRIILRIG
jgi:hypothetical protein